MLLPLSVAVLSVAIGATLAWIPGLGPRVLGPARTFATCAAITVVLAHLLPEAFGRLGLAGVGALGAGLALPRFAERFARRHPKHVHPDSPPPSRGDRPAEAHVHDDDAASLVGLAALLAHQVGDGMGLFAFAGGARPSFDVALALGAHTVPLSMLAVMGPLALVRPKQALVRVLSLAGATCFGVGLGAIVPAQWVSAAEPWIGAVVGGFLLHVIWHDLDADPPANARHKALDLGVAALGIALSIAGVAAADAHVGQAEAIAAAFVRHAAPLAPALLVACGLVVTLRWVANRLEGDAFLDGRGLLRGSWLALALQADAREAMGVVKRLRASPRAAAAFLLLSPIFALDGGVVVLVLFGWRTALLRAAGLGIGALGALALVGAPGGSSPSVDHDHDAGDRTDRARGALEMVLERSLPRAFAGVGAAAYLVSFLPHVASRSSTPIIVGIAAAVCWLVSPPLVTLAPVAAALVGLGLAPVAATSGICSVGAPSPGAVNGLRGTLGAVRAWCVTLVTLGAAGVVTWLLVGRASSMPGVATPTAFSIGCLVVLAFCAVIGVWRTGVRGWIAAVTAADHVHE